MDIGVVVSAASAVISVGAVLVAGSQARYARQQAQAAVRQTELQEQIRRDAAQPFVWVDLRPDPKSMTFIHLVVQNDGPTVAQGVQVTFVPPLQSTIAELEPLLLHNALAQGFPSLPPGRRLVWSLDVFPARFASDLPRQYEVTITGHGPFGPLEPLVYQLSLSDYEGTEANRQGTLKGVEDQLAKIERALKAPRPPRIRSRPAANQAADAGPESKSDG
ncbi:MAG: hypothetical protein ACR2KL_08760 [Nocardioidaceae bacterium]